MLEESFERLNKEQCATYLKRLGISLPDQLSSGFLDKLIQTHLYKIPFENLDLIKDHKVISTDLETVYQKIVLGNRGGYCFELNALFLGLLRGLGIYGLSDSLPGAYAPGASDAYPQGQRGLSGRQKIFLRRRVWGDRLYSRGCYGTGKGDGDRVWRFFL